MRVSLRTLRRLVALPKSVTEEEMAQRLTLAGFETALEKGIWSGLNDVLLAKVLQVQDIAGHSELKLCQLDIGKQRVQVVCGARNVAKNALVAYVPPATQLPSGKQVSTKTACGLDSVGMLCCAADLGLCESSEGVAVVPKEHVDTNAIGSPFGKAAGLLDTVLDIDVTPNRPDALGHVGIARELSACLQVPMLSSKPRCQEIQASADTAVHVHVQQRQHCPRFACRVIDGIVVRESPLWLQTLLTDCGLRSINNVVDVTNWVMLHRGQPLHAYDRDCLAQDRQRAQLVVRLAKAKEKLQLLDDDARELSPGDLVVADTRGPLALAGVMGGKTSGVSSSTQSVVLEAAYFNPATIRQMVQRHRLNTQASHRMERGCDPGGIPSALDEAAQWLKELASGRVLKGVIDVCPSKIERAVISFRPTRFYQVSGISKQDVDESCLLRLLGSLGIETLGRRGDAICFSAPTFRPDLTREVDLIEEAMRLVGYDRVPAAPLISYAQSEPSYPCPNCPNVLSEYVRKCLVGQGFCEAVNTSLGSCSKHHLFCKAAAVDMLQMQNPLGEETKALRYSLLPGLLESASRNMKRGVISPRLFELGIGFSTCHQKPLQEGKLPDAHQRWAEEILWAAGAMAGQMGSESFDRKAMPVDFYDVKGVVAHVLACLGLWKSWQEGCIVFRTPPKGFTQLFHPGLSAALYHRTKGSMVGIFGQFHPQICEAYALKKDAFGFEINLTAVQEDAQISQHFVSPPNRYPTMHRDLAVVVPESVTAQQIVDLLLQHNQAQQWVQDMRFFDLYRGPSIAPNHKSLGLSVALRAPDRTLTDSEASAFMTTFIAKLEKSLKASVRT